MQPTSQGRSDLISDFVIASEMMEVGRAMLRGFVTGKTTLIGSSHRDFAIVEKQELGDGRRESEEIDAIASATAARYFCFDMDAVARDNGTVISSVLFGTLCASSALPFSREQFEDTIRSSGRGVEASLAGFAAGIEAAGGIQEPKAVATAEAPSPIAAKPRLAPELAAIVEDLRGALPDEVFDLAIAGLGKVVDHQDIAYGHDYAERVTQFTQLDRSLSGERGWELSGAVARYLALAMAYDDVIRVADIKTRSGRFETFREDIKAEDGQVVHIREFMHPRWQEICEILPRGIGGYLSRSRFWQRVTAPLFSRGRRVRTTSLTGFLLLFTLGRLRRMRRMSLRFANEQRRIADWLSLVEETAARDYELAVEIAGLQRLIKGYGDTHARSMAHVDSILAALPGFAEQPDAAERLRALKQAALADEDGAALHAQLDMAEAA